jgi:hypothetical protein
VSEPISPLDVGGQEATLLLFQVLPHLRGGVTIDVHFVEQLEVGTCIAVGTFLSHRPTLNLATMAETFWQRQGSSHILARSSADAPLLLAKALI